MGNDRFIPDVTKQTSLTFLFGITTFGIADELLAETLGLEAAPVEVEVISILLIEWEMNGYPTSLCAVLYGERVSKGGLLAFYSS